ncbi:MAG TPA: homoserine kinase [Ktedonobacterales bacterium]
MTLFPAPMPAIHTILSANALIERVLARYQLPEPITCRLFFSGLNDTYLVEAGRERYVLRVYRTGGRSIEAIRYELDLLRFLSAKGANVSAPIAPPDGDILTVLPALEGPRAAVLFTYAPGQPPDRHSPADTAGHGRALATLHNVSAAFASAHTRPALDLAYLLDEPLAHAAGQHSHRTEDWAYFCEMTRRVRSMIEQFAREGLTWSVCHGDCHMDNTHVDEHGLVTFFDFDFCGPGWLAYDLAISGWAEAFYEKDPDGRLWSAFLEGYRSVRPISPVDLRAVPAFVAAREIWHTALWIYDETKNGEHALDRVFSRTIRLLRAWDERYLR